MFLISASETLATFNANVHMSIMCMAVCIQVQVVIGLWGICLSQSMHIKLI